MFQTLILIASVIVLASAILTSALVSAKNSFNQIVTAKTQTAMTDATAQFTAWAQASIAANGTEQQWTGMVNPNVVAKPMCAGIGPCQFYETTTWTVTGATASQAPAQNTGQAYSSVQNMATIVDEQRISATVSVAVSDPLGHKIYGGRSEEITARIVNGEPYIVVTGVRDLAAEMGTTANTEGDSGGHQQVAATNVHLAPNYLNPSAMQDTVIRATIDCDNTALFNQANPTAPQDNANGNIISVRQGGNQAWAYQMPCDPKYSLPGAPNGLTNYSPPVGNVYRVDASNSSATWNKGDQIGTSFPR